MKKYLYNFASLFWPQFHSGSPISDARFLRFTGVNATSLIPFRDVYSGGGGGGAGTGILPPPQKSVKKIFIN